MKWPTGIVTFLFTDIEGSSALWEKYPAEMGADLTTHDRILKETIEAHGGVVFKTIGDAFCAVFSTAGSVLETAISAQKSLWAEDWEVPEKLKVRMAIHTGEAEFRDGDYFGNPLNRVSRILAAAHGGQVLVSLSTEELSRDSLPSDSSLMDLGEYRLRGLLRPERIYQILATDLPSEFPRLRNLELVPNNLPANVSSFVGREKELEVVRRLLQENRLVTLTGTGGTGKTRMALQLGTYFLESFPEGVWFVELATLNDPERVVDSVAAALDIREEPGIPLNSTLQRSLSARNALLILDNCEHLQQACAELSSGLLKHCPGIKLLATSRHSMGISGEHAFAVPPLATYYPGRDVLRMADPVQTISQFESVRLFLDRAVAVKSDFLVTRENIPAIAQICWRLDGIPLAIELAAARVRVLSPAQIAERLDDRFRLLTGGNRSVLPHQQTLRALIDWSYDLLSPEEKILLQRLGVFGGGRSLEAIEQVCAGEGVDIFGVLDLLQQLVDKSLVSIETGAEGEARYTMIESVWRYVREKFDESGDKEELREKHMEFFLHMAGRISPALEGPDVVEWLEKADQDRFNFRLALDWSLEKPERLQKGLRLAVLLANFWEIRGHFKEARQYFDRLIHSAKGFEGTREYADALCSSARVAWLQDQTDLAIGFYRDAGALYQALGEERRYETSRAFLAFNLRTAGDVEEASEIFDQVVAFAERTSDRHLLSIARNGQAAVASDRGDMAGSRRLREESLAGFRSEGNKWITGYMLWGLARSCLACHDPTGTRKALDEWLAITEELKTRWAAPYILYLYAGVLREEGDIVTAAKILGSAESAKENLSMQFDAVDLRETEKIRKGILTALDSEGFAAAFEEGSSLTYIEALQLSRSTRSGNIPG